MNAVLFFRRVGSRVARRPALRLVLQLLVSSGLVYLLVRHAEVRALHRVLRHVRTGWLAAALAALVSLQGVSAFKWWLVLRYAGHPVRYRRCLRLYFVGMFFNLMMPTGVGGDAVRAAALRRTVSLTPAVASVFVERLTGFVAMIAIGMGAVLLDPGDDAAAFRALALATGCIVLAGVVLFGRLPRRIADRWPRWLDTFRQLWRDRVAGPVHACLPTLRSAAAVMLLSFCFQWGIVGIHLLLVHALTASIGLRYVCLAYPVATVASLMPVSLNGLGFREGAYVVLLGNAGIAPQTALGLALLWTLVMWCAGLPGALLWGTGPRG